MPHFVVTENTPGYLPEDDPSTFDTFAAALAYARERAAECADMLEQCHAAEYETTETLDGEYARLNITTDEREHDLGRVIEVTSVPTKKYRRSVVYEIEAVDAEQADEAWADDGPECAEAGSVRVIDEGTIFPA